MNKCPNCGAPLEGKRCSYCNYEVPVINNDNHVNEHVDYEYKNIQNNTTYVFNNYCSNKSKGVALLLCIFLGGLGAHYFYVGRLFKGLLYLFTAGLFGFGWIIDIFVILFGRFKDSNGFPLI